MGDNCVAEVTRLDSSEEFAALMIGDVVDARMMDGYEGPLVCGGEMPSRSKEKPRIMTTPKRDRAYLLVSGHIQTDGGVIVQHKVCPNYYRATHGNLDIFHEIDGRLPV